MGLVRLVHAAKLVPIEEAIASLGSSSAPTPSAPPRISQPVPQASPRQTAASPQQTAAPPPITGDFRTRLLTTLLEEKKIHLADAVEHAEVAESPTEIIFTAPKLYQMFLKDTALDAIIKRVAGRPVRVNIKIGDVAVAPPSAAPRPNNKVEGDAADRALSHPEVKRFQELFPGAQVRTVRNLKENES